MDSNRKKPKRRRGSELNLFEVKYVGFIDMIWYALTALVTVLPSEVANRKDQFSYSDLDFGNQASDDLRVFFIWLVRKEYMVL